MFLFIGKTKINCVGLVRPAVSALLCQLIIFFLFASKDLTSWLCLSQSYLRIIKETDWLIASVAVAVELTLNL